MKKQILIISFFVVLFLMSGCKSSTTTSTTGKVATEICDDSCQQEKDDYISSINNLLTQAQVITSKVSDWKSVTQKDLGEITALKDQVSVLKMPQDFETAHDYYSRAFGHYVEAVNYAVKANEEYKSSSNNLNIELRNKVLTRVIDNAQEANKLLVYAEEEAKFATHIISKV